MTFIDARELKCPFVIKKLKEEISKLEDGEHMMIVTKDPLAKIDIGHFCNSNGHRVWSMYDDPFSQELIFGIEKNAK